MEKFILYTVCLSIIIATFGCDECKDIACFSPPNEFNFQLVDKENGEDLIVNGTYNANEISIVSLLDEKKHELVQADQGTTFYFTDSEIGWETGAENTKYELRINDKLTYSFTYETQEVSDECCTFFEILTFEMDAVETLYFTQTNVFQLKI